MINHTYHLHPGTAAARQNCREAREVAAEMTAQAVVSAEVSITHVTTMVIAPTVYLIRLTGPYLIKTIAVRVEGRDTADLQLHAYGFDQDGGGIYYDPTPQLVADPAPARQVRS